MAGLSNGPTPATGRHPATPPQLPGRFVRRLGESPRNEYRTRAHGVANDTRPEPPVKKRRVRAAPAYADEGRAKGGKP